MSTMPVKPRAGRNRTTTLTDNEQITLSASLYQFDLPQRVMDVLDKVVCQDVFEAAAYLPAEPFVDMLFLDPPYNMDKTFNGERFRRKSDDAYSDWLDDVLKALRKTLKLTASIYVCATWESAAAVYQVLIRHFHVRNRITWEREKGRGAKHNWKNASEDIWFCTVSDDYTFNVEDVKLKRRVIAPYTTESGQPKDWENEPDGRYRLTYPSNLWTDITVPFWSMPENTDHPTQKPEKLLAKLILASTNAGDVVFDPFLGSGSAAVTARKLGRRFLGIELDSFYCSLALKRLKMAETNTTIQGYADGVFWERNSGPAQSKTGLDDSEFVQYELFDRDVNGD